MTRVNQAGRAWWAAVCWYGRVYLFAASLGHCFMWFSYMHCMGACRQNLVFFSHGSLPSLSLAKLSCNILALVHSHSGVLSWGHLPPPTSPPSHHLHTLPLAFSPPTFIPASRHRRLYCTAFWHRPFLSQNGHGDMAGWQCWHMSNGVGIVALAFAWQRGRAKHYL